MTEPRKNPKSFVVTSGDTRAPNRAMLRAVGFGDGDFDKPIVGVSNAHSTITPCNAGLNRLAAGPIGRRGHDAYANRFRSLFSRFHKRVCSTAFRRKALATARPSA